MNNDRFIQVRTLARAVRDWVESQDNTRKIPSIGLNGWCAIASAELSRKLEQEGIAHEICMAECDEGCHVFLLIEDYVVDVTATQFGGEFYDQPIVIQHHRELDRNWFHDPVYFFDNARTLRKHQIRSGWPLNQTAYAK